MTQSHEDSTSLHHADSLTDYRFRFVPSPQMQKILEGMVGRTDQGQLSIEPFLYSRPTILDAADDTNQTLVASIREKLGDIRNHNIQVAAISPIIKVTEDEGYEIGFRLYPAAPLRSIMGKLAMRYRYNHLAVVFPIPGHALGPAAANITSRLAAHLSADPKESSKSAVQAGRYVNDVRLVEKPHEG